MARLTKRKFVVDREDRFFHTASTTKKLPVTPTRNTSAPSVTSMESLTFSTILFFI
jgi:hypothetical protein